LDWIGLSSVLRPRQHRLYGRRFLKIKRPNQQYQSTEGDATKEKTNNENNYTYAQTIMYTKRIYTK